jgi:hypothetical protein
MVRERSEVKTPLGNWPGRTGESRKDVRDSPLVRRRFIINGDLWPPKRTYRIFEGTKLTKSKVSPKRKPSEGTNDNIVKC